jgi:hypothetical protein
MRNTGGGDTGSAELQMARALARQGLQYSTVHVCPTIFDYKVRDPCGSTERRIPTNERYCNEL